MESPPTSGNVTTAASTSNPQPTSGRGATRAWTGGADWAMIGLLLVIALAGLWAWSSAIQEHQAAYKLVVENCQVSHPLMVMEANNDVFKCANCTDGKWVFTDSE